MLDTECLQESGIQHDEEGGTSSDLVFSLAEVATLNIY